MIPLCDISREGETMERVQRTISTHWSSAEGEGVSETDKVLGSETMVWETLTMAVCPRTFVKTHRMSEQGVNLQSTTDIS